MNDTSEQTINWFNLRNTLAAQHQPHEALIKSCRESDRLRNPHNDSHKPPLRSETQIVSDLKFQAADHILLQQYGALYLTWLKATLKLNEHTQTWQWPMRAFGVSF